MSAVAGDFYDFLLINNRQVGILVADVTGHGIPAALIASMLKVAFAGQAPHASDPTRVLTGLNQARCGKFKEHFVTAAYLFVDLERRLLHYSAAGHPPLLLASRTEGEAREIEENGLMLGLFPNPPTPPLKSALDPEIVVCSIRTVSWKPKTRRRKNSVSHAVRSSWKPSAIFRPLAFFLATNLAARRRMILLSSSSISKWPLNK
jgi:hypothetical protein